jgi:hypothetical protein
MVTFYRCDFLPTPQAARQGCRARMPGKAAGQGCRAKLHGMVQYAESMVKLDNNAVF